MKTKYNLGSLEFSSKDAIKKHVQSIFAKYKIGERLNEEDFQFVRDLLEWHPQASRKIGAGVSHFEIWCPPPFSSKGFLLCRVDGTQTDFSYRVCLTPSLADKTVKYASAMRRAISPEISEFKMQAFQDKQLVQCAETGDMLTWENAHVDHHPEPFCDLLDRYTRKSHIEVKNLVFAEDDTIGAVLLDKRLIDDFAQWHREHANLRIIKDEVNIQLGSRLGRRRAG